MSLAPNAKATASIAAQDSFTDWMMARGLFNLSIGGTFVATVTLQRRFQGGDPADVESFTAPAEEQYAEDEPGVEYRLGVKTGDYTSGDAACRLSL